VSEDDRLQHEFKEGVKDLKGAAKELVGKLIESDELVEEGRREQRESTTPRTDAYGGPSRANEGASPVSGEKSGREW
jgi:uncharacterized protein YjbJ (UPF0337 family)